MSESTVKQQRRQVKKALRLILNNMTFIERWKFVCCGSFTVDTEKAIKRATRKIIKRGKKK